MTKRSKFMVASSILLALCVISSTVVWAAAKTDDMGMSPAAYVGIAITAGLLSVLAVYFFGIKKNKYERILTGEYMKSYETLRMAVANANLPIRYKNEIREDVLDLLVCAQQSGKTAADAVGDPESFAREIIRSYADPGRLAFLSIFDAVIAFMLFILGSTILIWLEQPGRPIFSVQINISMLVFFALVAFAVIPVTKRYSASEKPWAYALPLGSGAVFVITIEILRKYGYGFEPVRMFLDGMVSMMPNLFSLIAYIAVPLLACLVKQCVRRRLLSG